MEKMTNRKALGYVIDHYDLPKDVADKLNAMVEAINRKNSTERKPTAKQVENEGLRDALVDYIVSNCGDSDGFTVSDLIKNCEVANGLSNQKVSAILRVAVKDKRISKHSVKRRTYFCAYNPAFDEVESEGEEE